MLLSRNDEGFRYVGLCALILEDETKNDERGGRGREAILFIKSERELDNESERVMYRVGKKNGNIKRCAFNFIKDRRKKQSPIK